ADESRAIAESLAMIDTVIGKHMATISDHESLPTTTTLQVTPARRAHVRSRAAATAARQRSTTDHAHCRCICSASGLIRSVGISGREHADISANVGIPNIAIRIDG